MQLRYPRIIHSEFMTHKVFGRNGSSSRAITLSRMIEAILRDPAEPVEWGSNQRGMQAGEPLRGLRLAATRAAWHGAKRCAILMARVMQLAGAHKQVANRILEPWSHISVVVTSVYWDNFFALRDHKDADPTIQELARKMHKAYQTSQPRELAHGEWHLPYAEDPEMPLGEAKIRSAARCARVSYNNHDGTTSSFTNDLRLVDQLLGEPVHATPFEHQATPDGRRPSNGAWNNPKLHGNLRGWKQFRKMIPNEAVMENY